MSSCAIKVGVNTLSARKGGGVTETTLSRRFTMHKDSRAPKTHYNQVNDLPLAREDLEKNTKILLRENDSYRLYITKALIMQLQKSSPQPTSWRKIPNSKTHQSLGLIDCFRLVHGKGFYVRQLSHKHIVIVSSDT